MKIVSLVLVSLFSLLTSTLVESKDKCSVCKDFSSSFKKEFDKTSKLNYAGGDTAWEEEKLGSYANSEVRFVEIMESVCERSDHDCHSLVSDNEEELEEWWINERRKGESDIELWLCHNHLEVCCPENTFGKDCQPCPGGVEKPCNDHGTCEGAGRRVGKGTCSCSKEYTGDLCDQCSAGHYNDSDKCVVCHMSCELECFTAGPKGCSKCKEGWIHDTDIGCKDINECNEDTADCDDDTYCHNTPGSYSCKDCDFSCDGGCSGPGNKACEACADGHYQSEDGACLDKDECSESDTELCKEGTYCENVPGSYKCQACHVACLLACTGPGKQGCVECKSGYGQVNGLCEDVNECEAEEDPCELETEICDNLPGTFMCKCKPGHEKVDGKCVVVKKPKKKKISTKSRNPSDAKPTTEDTTNNTKPTNGATTDSRTEL
ncbi:cysteine-rich with EGF-like domain protein 2 isoform X2 [Dysidea avara]|uniref:cysteine-rich with EGF-like domain protein 2 isoform X2 n=1 Tax=Dysidea avara TaxID=196820 RepID=UPI0033280910